MAKVVKLKNNYIVSKEIISTISSKGQVTLPVEIREFLGVDKNDKVAFVVNDEGNVELNKPEYPDLESIFGAAGYMTKPMELEELIDKAVEERIKSKYLK